MRGSIYAGATRPAASAASGLRATVVTATKAARATCTIWRDRVRYRRALARMSERELADIGVNWSEIANEAGKPFWRE
jgi:uncharacterized protein YjiS (DUF1127 family)